MSRRFSTAIVLPGNPSAALEAAPKQYVDLGDAGRTFNVMAYGATGDGVTDDTTAINAAITASSPGGVISFPAGTYVVSSTIQLVAGRRYQGAGGRSGLSIVKASAALTGGAVLAAAGWFNNGTSCDNPLLVDGIKIDCNLVSGAHGLVIYNFWSRFNDIHVVNVNGATANGFLATDTGRNGTTVTANSHSENTFSGCRVDNATNKAAGFRGVSANGASNQDGHIVDSFFSAVTGYGIVLGRAAGWTIENNHLYGIGYGAISLTSCYGTRVIGNYVEDFGGDNGVNNGASPTFGFYTGINLETVLNSRATIVANNTVSTTQPSSPTGQRWTCFGMRAGSGQLAAQVVLSGNSAVWAAAAPATNRSQAFRLGEGGDSGRMLYVEWDCNQIDATIAWQFTRVVDATTVTLSEPALLVPATGLLPYAKIPVGTTAGTTVADGGHTHTADLVGVTRAGRASSALTMTGTLANVTGMALSVSANGVYIVEGLFLYSSTVNDVTVLFTIPSGAGGTPVYFGLDPAGTVAAGINSVKVDASSSFTAGSVLNASSIQTAVLFKGVLTVGVTAGTLQAQARMSTTGTGSIAIGSYVTALRVA
jgi:parallel beta-helix repeat protein